MVENWGTRSGENYNLLALPSKLEPTCGQLSVVHRTPEGVGTTTLRYLRNGRQVVACTQSSEQPSSTGSLQVCTRVIITSLHLSPVAGSIIFFCHDVEPLFLILLPNLIWHGHGTILVLMNQV